ncbi:UDP-N-acetylmuramate dehydrogenase [Qiania dongpingensis]|uniref:UDP-N-acetylenolpyruvoylglucosamine reductase n=1 Tax=Qiania dongpingensis TaxID=2763669 RepID=A0A7G9G2N2_9FIRM|nr:UDP-N-acetylmuramate dehydrogenase [Qiania dongpingensis]QNM05064.1 UDP-N-acetylmuramate dehydrogenase [Qiania dongpingensis]
MDLFCDRLQEAGIQVCCDEPMKKHTTFQIGGPADYFVTPGGRDGLGKTIRLCREMEKPYFILGNGSNLLVSDRGYRGVIIHMGKAFGQVEAIAGGLRAGSGAMLAKVALKALEEELTGLEFASGIPGTLGGAMVMNAGAYGGEMAQVVRCARVLTEDGEEKELSLAELEMGYRRSCILPRRYIVTEVEVDLTSGDKTQIRARMDELSARRKEKQPLEFPSAGSTFKRPEGYFAGKLIMDAGLRGYAVGGACVSEKHCGFVINKGGATAENVLDLCRDIQKRVQEKFGVLLEMEIRTLGDFS